MKRLMSTVLILCLVIATLTTTSVFADTNVNVSVISQAEWNNIRYAGEGFFAVEKDFKWGFIDSSGKVIVEPKWDEVGDFYNGIARVSDCEFDTPSLKKESSTDYPAFANVYFVDKSGNILPNINSKIESEYAVVFGADLAIINNKDGVIAFYTNADDGTNFYNKDGKRLLNAHSYWKRIDEGLISVAFYNDNYNVSQIPNGDKPSGYGFIDIDGNIKIEGKFQDVRPFNQNIAPAKFNDKWGFIDKTGKFIIEPIYEDFAVSDPNYSYCVFYNGLACVKKDGLWGVIDKTGQVISDFKWDGINAYKNEFTVAFTKNAEGAYTPKALINTKGKVLENSEWVRFSTFNQGIAAVKADEKWGYIDSDGKFLVNPKYDDCSSFYNDIAFVRLNGVYSLIDKKGNTVTKESWNWDSVNGFMYENYAGFMQNDKWGLVKAETNISTNLSATQKPIQVIINGEEKLFSVPPQIINQRTMIPLREICEQLGMQVDYDDNTRTAILSKNGITIVHKIGEKSINIDGQKVEFDTPSTIINSRTLVPVSMMARAINAKIDWNGELRTVTITTN